MINRNGKVCITCLRQGFFFTFNVNVKWRSETFDKINVINAQSVVVLNMNMEVFRIYDMNTLYKLGNLKYNGKYLGKFGCGPNLPRLKWPKLPLTDFFQISLDSFFKDTGNEINNVLYRSTYSFRNKKYRI